MVWVSEEKVLIWLWSLDHESPAVLDTEFRSHTFEPNFVLGCRVGPILLSWDWLWNLVWDWVWEWVWDWVLDWV